MSVCRNPNAERPQHPATQWICNAPQNMAVSFKCVSICRACGIAAETSMSDNQLSVASSSSFESLCRITASTSADSRVETRFVQCRHSGTVCQFLSVWCLNPGCRAVVLKSPSSNRTSGFPRYGSPTAFPCSVIRDTKLASSPVEKDPSDQTDRRRRSARLGESCCVSASRRFATGSSRTGPGGGRSSRRGPA